MNILSPNRPAKETESWMFKDLCSKCLNQMDPNAFASSQFMKPGCALMASLTNDPIRYGWLLTGRDQLCFDEVSRVGSDWFPFFFPTRRVQSRLTLPQKSTLCWNCCKAQEVPSPSRQRQCPQSQGHFDLPKGAIHPGSGPSPLQSRPGSVWLLVVPPQQRKVGSVEFFSLQSGRGKSSRFRAARIVSIRLWFLAQVNGLCVQSGGESFQREWLL